MIPLVFTTSRHPCTRTHTDMPTSAIVAWAPPEYMGVSLSQHVAFAKVRSQHVHYIRGHMYHCGCALRARVPTSSTCSPLPCSVPSLQSPHPYRGPHPVPQSTHDGKGGEGELDAAAAMLLGIHLCSPHAHTLPTHSPGLAYHTPLPSLIWFGPVIAAAFVFLVCSTIIDPHV